MQELSLNILDIAQNSITAKATVIEITVLADENDMLTITVSDNGTGMSMDMLKNVTNPFCTSRTTRKVGLGIPFFKQAAEDTGGSFSISSTENVGTTVTAVFDTKHIDYTPLGEIWDTIAILVQMNETLDFLYTVKSPLGEFIFDTVQVREIMQGLPLSDLNVVQFMKEYIKENQFEILKRSY